MVSDSGLVAIRVVPPLVVALVVVRHQRHADVVALVVLVSAGGTCATGMSLGCHRFGSHPILAPASPPQDDTEEDGPDDERQECEDRAGDDESDDSTANLSLVADRDSRKEHFGVTQVEPLSRFFGGGCASIAWGLLDVCLRSGPLWLEIAPSVGALSLNRYFDIFLVSK